MAGIFGCFRFHGEKNLAAVADTLRQSARSGIQAGSQEGAVTREQIHLGYVMAARPYGKESLIHSSGANSSLLLFGELFLPSGATLSAENFDKEFLPGYERDGNDFFLQCDGAFILALYDDRKKSLLLVTDPFGNFALHYTERDDIFIFSTQQKGIALASGETGIDERSFAEMISLGQLLDGRTLWKNIHRIQPATCMMIHSSGEIAVKKYYTPDYQKNRSQERDEVLAEIEEALLHAVDMWVSRPHTICGLTGGMDSRITLAAIKRLGKTGQITAFTHGLSDSGDMKTAEQLSVFYHIPHLRKPFDEDFFKQLPGFWREAVSLSEGGLGIESALNIPSWKLQSGKFSASMDSHGGPLYRRQILKSREGILARSENFEAAVFNWFASPFLDSDILRTDIRKQARNAGSEAVKHYFSSLPQKLSVGDRIDLFYLQQMCTNKYSLSGNAQMNFIGLSHPLLSLKAYDAVTRIPTAERRKNVIYTYLLNRFAPELKQFTVDNSGFQVPYMGYRFLRYIPQAWDRGLMKLPHYFRRFSVRKPIVTGEILASKNFDAMKELLLAPDSRVQQYFDLAHIERELSDFQKGRKDNFNLLTQAVNVRLILELFG